MTISLNMTTKVTPFDWDFHWNWSSGYKNQTGRSYLRRKRSERTVNRKHRQVEQASAESEMETPSFIMGKSDEEDETLIVSGFLCLKYYISDKIDF